MNTAKPAKIPSLLQHKASGRAFVRLNGKDHYVGAWGDEASEQAYNRLVAEWLANGRRLQQDVYSLTINDLCDAYENHASEYYVDADGKPTSTQNIVRRALKALRALYGDTPALDFGPNALRALRDDRWVRKGLTRNTVNDYAAVVKRAFKWAVSREMLPPKCHQALVAVEGLKRNRSKAKENQQVKPVPEAHIEAAKRHAPRPIRALIELQLLTGARPGELLELRAIDFDTSSSPWVVTPDRHKTAYRGRERNLLFGPKAQNILRGFMADRPINAYLFSPKDAEAERHAQADTHRRPNQKPNPRKTERTLGDHYKTDSYRSAIKTACDKAKIPSWSPNQLRHTAATSIRRQFGLEGAQVILGHSNANVTEIYAEVDRERARSIVQDIG